ncbi:restriction endonuclease subunit S [Lactobacillus delbrueckii]|uniref:restriction endonuclease subunit S n=1 Tax=Lactobacillus delbrueckii TaxID=1584 RepID=UPI002DB8F876|nr:restriction endonuclease subunit S [Lactobacillus delbrueckii]WRV88435.1 restriction endonuclease subunit S [Lactobacillus delbrueckii subsp. bulgaricus]
MPGHAGTGGRDVIFAWEQRKLGEITDVRDGTHASPHYVNSGFPLLTSKNISNGCINYNEVNYISEYDFHQINERSKVDVNDILMGMIGTIGNLALVQEKTNFAIKNVALIKNTGSIDHRFLFQDLQTDYIERELSNNMDGGTQKFISLKKIRNLSITFPTLLNEQDKIGNLFHFLDSTITLHEEKKQQLKCLKSALLQKMFANKNKSGDPDVRFKGFDERWERHILNDLAIFNPKGTLPTSFEYVDLGSVIGVEMISHKTISKFDAPSRAQRLAQVGDLFYQTVRPYQQNNYLFDNKDNAYVFSTGYAQLRPLIDGYFLLCLVQTKSFVRKVMNACTGTSYPAINSQDLAQIGVNIPINSKEQRLIGNLYKVIDNLITLYQQKLDDLNTIKQSLLQKMFI